MGPSGTHMARGCRHLCLVPGSEQHPKRSFGLVGFGSGDLPERVRETLKVPRITLS